MRPTMCIVGGISAVGCICCGMCMLSRTITPDDDAVRGGHRNCAGHGGASSSSGPRRRAQFYVALVSEIERLGLMYARKKHPCSPWPNASCATKTSCSSSCWWRGWRRITTWPSVACAR